MNTNKPYEIELTITPSIPLYPVCTSSPPNTNCFNAHCHERVEMLIITEGEIFLEIMGETYRATAGDIAVINPYFPHAGYTKSSSVKYVILMLHIGDAFNGNMFAKKLLQPVIDRQSAFKTMIRDSYIYDTVMNLVNTQEQRFLGFEFSHLSKGYGILGRLFEKHIDTKYEKPAINNKFKEAVNFINQNYNKPISTSSICSKYGYAEAYFCRKFKQVTGLTPMVYIKILRLESAKNPLKETKTDIRIIAEACGFADMGYFQKSFKELYGMTPIRYRKSESN